MKVLCANCSRQMEDGGKNYTCEHCGMSPVPSYSYGEDSPFNPANCDCQVLTRGKPGIVKQRRNPLPTKLKL